MGDDERLVLLISSVVLLVAAGRWYLRLWKLHRFVRQPATRAALAIVPPGCMAGLLWTLQTAADPQVRGHAEYLALFMAAGGALLGFTAAALLVVLGISVRADALERHNGPAATVVCGALVAVTVVFAGANVGTGDTIWTTLGPAALAVAALAVAALAVVAFAHAWAGGLTEAVTVDRNPAAAVRAVGLHVGVALVLARAVAGDFVSVDATLADFARRGWPAVPLAIAAVGVDRLHAIRPWPTRRAVWPAVATAVAYVGAAVLGMGVVR